MKSGFGAALVAVTGALLGSFLGKALAALFPQGRLRDMLATEITAGLHPARVDLHVVDLTVGCLFHLNVLSVVGIIAAAWLYRKALR